MPSQTDGLIVSPSGEYKSREQIIYDNMEKIPPTYEENPYTEVSFDQMIEEMIRRRDSRVKFESIPDMVEIDIPSTTPVIIGIFGDQHLSGRDVDYEMLRRDAHFIAENPKCYTILGGDTVDGAAFNPAQDDKIASFTEETAMAIKMFDMLGKDSILAALQGDHDMWSERGGPTMYQNFRERYGTPLLRGASTIKLKVGDTEYIIVCAHKLPGHSQFSGTHPQKRESVFGKQAADIYIGFHNHGKENRQGYAKIAGVGTIQQTYIAGGPYKLDDSYSAKNGYSRKEPGNEAEVGATWLLLHPERKCVEAFWQMQSAKERIEPYLTGKLKSTKPADPIDIIKEIAK